MNSPISNFLKEYTDKATARLHMPGHKGRGFIDAAFDITEIEGADVLYAPSGIIRESERYAEELFETARTVYSVEGSSLSIKAMVYLATLYAKRKGLREKILAARNVHKSFINALGLVGCELDFIYTGTGDIISATVTPADIEKALDKEKTPPCAVYITTPDYLGNILDVRGIAEVCHERGVLLLVDNAHGAYLAFLEENLHPIHLGADMCCDSAHKTLPALTGAGYLHISRGAPEFLSREADEAMAIFASTSPSYLILASLDALNVNISSHFKNELNEFAPRVIEFKGSLRELGYTVPSGEVLKVTLLAKEYGYTGTEIAQILQNDGYVCEFYDDDYVVMMLAPMQKELLNGLYKVLKAIPKRDRITRHAPRVTHPKRALTVREAILSPAREVCVEEALGTVAATASVSCPPAIPIVVSGEIIDEECIEAFKYYGIKKVRVIERNS